MGMNPTGTSARSSAGSSNIAHRFIRLRATHLKQIFPMIDAQKRILVDAGYWPLPMSKSTLRSPV
jgi:hypothetical protein